MNKTDGRSKRLIDLTGKRFGKLVVIERAGNDKYHKPLWKCKCDCGNETIVSGAVLRRGDTTSCGCMQGIRKDLAYKPLIMRRTHANRLFNTWSGMIYRCENPHASHYSIYGGRGISVCEEWRNSYEAFAKWSLSHGYSDDKEIDRINNDGNYCPENCRWIPHKSNSRNRRARNQSGVSGVNFRPSRTGIGGTWRAGIVVDGKNINIGHFEKFEDAVEARKQAEIKYWGFTRIL